MCFFKKKSTPVEITPPPVKKDPPKITTYWKEFVCKNCNHYVHVNIKKGTTVEEFKLKEKNHKCTICECNLF